MHPVKPNRSSVDGNRRWAAERRLRLSVAARNFAGTPTLKSLRRISEIGFDTVDNFDWRDEAEFGIYLDALPALGLGAGVLVVNKVPDVDASGCGLVSPDDRDGFLRELELCASAAKHVHCTRLEVLTGNEVQGISRALQMTNCVDTLKAAAPFLKENGMTAVVEMLNHTSDHPGYFLNYLRDGVELIDRVASDNVKLLFDIYHVQVLEGNLIERLRQNIEYIGQIHFADVPGRHEPGTGEINYRNVFRAIYELGDRYRGFVTAEYHPTDNSFQDLVAVKQLATFRQTDLHGGTRLRDDSVIQS
jgi:hydroxypyruvate isomerase